MKQDLILFDVFQAIVQSMVVPGIASINFDAGRGTQIIKNLLNKDNSILLKNTKYPLVAFKYPAKVNRGVGSTTYGIAKISGIIIAALSTGTALVSDRMATGGTFKTILYPCYYELLKRFALSPYTNDGDPDAFRHTLVESPGNQPIGEGTTDYVDILELENFEFNINQIKTC